MFTHLILFVFQSFVLTYSICPIDIASNCQIPSEYIYITQPIEYRYQDISSTGTNVHLNDNEILQTPCNLTFNFDFYGKEYNQIYISPNGAVTFTPGVSLDTNSGLRAFPDYGNSLRTIIAGVYTHLSPSSGGSIVYEAFGNEPNRYFVVQWTQVPLYSSTNTIDFQIKIFETVNIIQIYIRNATLQNLHTIAGVQDETMTMSNFYLYSSNSSFENFSLQIQNECYGKSDDTLCGQGRYDECTLEARCRSGVCRAATKAINGTSCATGDLCAPTGKCTGGICISPTRGPYNSTVTCNPESCDPFTGSQKSIVSINGDSCVDLSYCTQNSYCYWSTCIGTNPIICPHSTSCQQPGICNATSGDCYYPLKPDYSPCSLNNTCMSGTTCHAGLCIADVVFPDGTSCTDYDECTAGDTCTNGTCIGIDVSCPIKQCFSVSCTGNMSCEYTQLPDGSACDDGDACTVGGTCYQGLCVNSTQLCATSSVCSNVTCDNGVCLVEGISGVPCDDHDSCTKDDQCVEGTCQGTVICLGAAVGKSDDTMILKLSLTIVSCVALVFLITIIGLVAYIIYRKKKPSFAFAKEEMAVRF